MRTTLTVDDHLLRDLKKRAQREGVPLKEMIHRALRAGLESLDRPPRKRRAAQPTFRMGMPGHYDLDKALQISGELEHEEVVRKLALRK